MAHPPHLPSWLTLSDIDNTWTYVHCIHAFDVNAFLANHSDFRLHGDPKLCAYGYSFILSATLALILTGIATYCFVALLRLFPGRHLHRKLLFFLLSCIGLIRGVFSVYYAYKLNYVHNTIDEARLGELFLATAVPQLAVTDILTSLVDFLLTLFWLRVLRATVPLPGWFFVSGAFAIMGGLVAVLVVDSHESVVTYNNTFFYIASILLVSAVLHLAVLINVAFKLYTFRYIVSPTLNMHFYRVLVIAGATMICWLVRCVALFLHGSVPATSGISLENPVFTLVYFDVLMVLPVILIALVFWRLSLELISAQATTTGSPLVAESPPVSSYPLTRFVPNLYTP